MPRAGGGHNLLSTQLLLPVRPWLRACWLPHAPAVAWTHPAAASGGGGAWRATLGATHGARPNHCLTMLAGHWLCPCLCLCRCGNMAAIMEVDEHMAKSFSQVGSKKRSKEGWPVRWMLRLAGVLGWAGWVPCVEVAGARHALTRHGPYPSSLALAPARSQFDPAPRRGEPEVTRRTPDYFL